MHDRPNDLPDDLLEVAERLREERPTLDPLAYDDVKTRVQARAARTPTRLGKGAILKSRTVISLIFAFGIFMSLTGVVMAQSAGDTQYSSQNTGTTTFNGTKGSNGSNGSNGANGTNGTNAVAPTEQNTAANNGTPLANTGYAAIPVLLGGVALLGSGLVLRRRAVNET